MINIKTIILGAALFIAGYGIKLFTHEQLSPPYPAASSKSNDEPSHLLLSQCENKNLELTKHIHEIEKFNNKFNNSTANNVTVPAAPSKKQEEDFQEKVVKEVSEQDIKSQLAILSKYHAENEIKKQQEFLKSINASSENMPQALSDNYKKETIDSVWAPEKKAMLDNYIAKNEFLRSVPNVESDCRSKQCKISILSDDQTVLSNLGENLRDLINSNQFNEYKFAFDEKNHTTSIYLDRISTN